MVYDSPCAERRYCQFFSCQRSWAVVLYASGSIPSARHMEIHLTGEQAVPCLVKMVCFGFIIHIVGNLVHPGKRMQYTED